MFVPKHIEQRAVDLEKIKAQKIIKVKVFIKEFQTNLHKLQTLKINDPKEQLFIDLLQDVILKVDQEKYPYSIFLFNQQDQYMFEYDWQHDIFYCQYDRVWSLFETKFAMTYLDCQLFISNQVETHFFFRPSTTPAGVLLNTVKVEKYFKWRPAITVLQTNYNNTYNLKN